MKFDMRVFLRNNNVPENYIKWYYEFLKDTDVCPSYFDIEEDNNSFAVGNTKNDGAFLLYSKPYNQMHANFSIGRFGGKAYITFDANKVEIDVLTEDDECFIKTFDYYDNELTESDMYFDSDAVYELFQEYNKNDSKYVWNGAKYIFDFLGISPDFEESKEMPIEVGRIEKYHLENDPYIIESCKNIYYDPETYIEEVNNKRNKMTL